MKKTIKYFFVIPATLFILATALLFFVGKGVGNDSDTKKELADSTIQQITSYYTKNDHYPTSLKELPLYKNEEFAFHINKRSFQYSSYGEKKSKYIFSWRGGAMDWTGYRCTNDKSELSKKQDGVVRTYTMPGGTICTVTDLH